MTSNVKKNLDFAKGALEVRMTRGEGQTVPLGQIFKSLGVDLPGPEEI